MPRLLPICHLVLPVPSNIWQSACQLHCQRAKDSPCESKQVQWTRGLYLAWGHLFCVLLSHKCTMRTQFSITCMCITVCICCLSVCVRGGWVRGWVHSPDFFSFSFKIQDTQDEMSCDLVSETEGKSVPFKLWTSGQKFSGTDERRASKNHLRNFMT